MLALSIAESYVKDFMQHLFAHDTFNNFEVRGVTIHAFTYFEISGEKVRNEDEKPTYCTWEELQPYVRNIIKGKEKPRAMKVVFAKSNPDQVHANAAALFINVNYEGNNKVTCTTATSQKNFDMDRIVNTQWDSWVTHFFNQKSIPVDLV